MKKIKPLTKTEQAWVNRLQRCFDRVPRRLEFVTQGDAWLMVVDRDGARASEISDGAARRDGIILAEINTWNLVHGVSG